MMRVFYVKTTPLFFQSDKLQSDILVLQRPLEEVAEVMVT